MDFTKNEKKTLKLLLGNARISDSSIAEKLKISSQAVGKIRKKLESSVIDSYTVNLNYNKLGIKIFAVAHSKLTKEGIDKGELEIEQKLLEEPNIISVYRLPSGSATHIILYGFRDMSEMDNFFHSINKKQVLHNYIEIKDLFTFSDHSLLKNNPLQLFQKIIEEENIGSKRIDFIELENFKKSLQNSKLPRRAL